MHIPSPISILRPIFLLASLALVAAAQEGGGSFGDDGFYDPDAEDPPAELEPELPELDAGQDIADGAAEADLLTFDPPADSGRFKLGGYAGVETRMFFEDPLYPGQLDTFQASLLLQPELFFETENDQHQFRFTPFFRYDPEDPERTHFDLREANWSTAGDGWDLLAGIGKIYWGVAESRHLVDVINQIDAVEDIDEEDKLGQPMLNLNFTRDWGTLGIYAMTGFRERSFPGAGGRLRPSIPVRDDDATFESDLAHWYPELALRYQHSIGGFDIGAHFFHGTGREPNLIPSADGTYLTPHYEIINQLGIDLQYTKDAWLWKLEAIGREGHGQPFLAAVGGLEYTFFQTFGTSADLGLLVEYLYDGRDSDAPPTAFDNDIFVGTRLALNDTQDTSLLAGAIFDPADSTAAILVEAERRLGDHWKIELEARIFAGSTEESAALRDFAHDSFLALRLTRHF